MDKSPSAYKLRDDLIWTSKYLNSDKNEYSSNNDVDWTKDRISPQSNGVQVWSRSWNFESESEDSDANRREINEGHSRHSKLNSPAFDGRPQTRTYFDLDSRLSTSKSPEPRLSPGKSPMLRLSPISFTESRLSPCRSPETRLSPGKSPELKLSPFNISESRLSPCRSPESRLSSVSPCRSPESRILTISFPDSNGTSPVHEPTTPNCLNKRYDGMKSCTNGFDGVIPPRNGFHDMNGNNWTKGMRAMNGIDGMNRTDGSTWNHNGISTNPNGTTVPVSDARRKLRRIICQSKGDPNYFASRA